ncbi:MAG: hypothetical protein SYR96_36665, partial [Actinomycetota bacterium]|nr:hypothetical protein [Actinomycetota bacterium]
STVRCSNRPASAAASGWCSVAGAVPVTRLSRPVMVAPSVSDAAARATSGPPVSVRRAAAQRGRIG